PLDHHWCRQRQRAGAEARRRVAHDLVVLQVQSAVEPVALKRHDGQVGARQPLEGKRQLGDRIATREPDAALCWEHAPEQASAGARLAPDRSATRAGATSPARKPSRRASSRSRSESPTRGGATVIVTIPSRRASDSSRDTLETELPIKVAISAWPRSWM